MLQDLRYALRNLLANRVFAAMALLSLALGVGANTAIYSFMDAILVRSLPVHDPSSLVMLNWSHKGRSAVVRGVSGSIYDDPVTGRTSPNLPFPVFELLSRDNPAFSKLAAFNSAYRLTALIRGEGTTVTGLYVSGGFFDCLGVPVAAGRVILSEDDREGATPVAVVSYGFAQRRFGRSSNALGEIAVINDVPFQIVGVTPPSFFGLNPGQSQDIYLPMRSSVLLDRIYSGDPRAKYSDGKRYWVEIFGRLRPGVTLEQAQALLPPLFHNFVSSQAANDKERADLPKLLVKDASKGLERLRRQYSKPLFFLMTLVGLILAIACANVANLLLARAAARRREIAVRFSLGASRLRIVRQLLTESVLLASLGGLVGLAFAQWGVRGLTILIANGRDDFALAAGLNWRVLAVTIGLALMTGVLFGLAPALQSARVDLISALKRTRAEQPQIRVRGVLRVSLSRGLVVSQIAISLLLLVAAGLFVRTLNKLNAVDLGFNRERLLLFSINARQAGYREQALTRFFGSLQDRLGTVPGVRSVSASNYALVSQTVNTDNITVAGYTGASSGASFLSVAPQFFATMQIPILLGRAIDERDVAAGARVAVINAVFATTYFEGQNPLGRRFTQGRGPNALDFEIVGVAKTARYSSLKGNNPPVAYMPFSADPRTSGQMTFALRAAGDPLALTNAVRSAVREADSRIPITNLTTQSDQIDRTIGQERTFAILCIAFALLAVAIACVGLYGTMAYSVTRRTNEIGLRMALGAEQRRLIWMILREVFTMAVIGLAIGIPIAMVTTKFVKAFLFEMQPNDPWSLAGAAVVLSLSAVAAGFGPAWRASRIDPWRALRHE
jgi:predicted permease